MSKKRERFDVIHDILATIQKDKKIGPTKLIRLANLSPKMFNDYIQELKSSGLIDEKVVKNRKKYILKEKGSKFLERYEIFTNFVDKLGL